MRNINGTDGKIPRGVKKLEDKFEKLKLEYESAKGDKKKSVLADLAKLLKSSQDPCQYFLVNCSVEQIRFANLVLEEVAEAYADCEFLEALRDAQRRFADVDLCDAMDSAAYAIAYAAFKKETKREKTLSDRVKGTARLKIRSEDGDSEAMYLLALRYYFGSVGSPNYKEARRWAELAIQNGYQDAAVVRDLPRES